MKSTNAQKGKSAYYNVSLASFEPEMSASLAMPDALDTADALAMPDALDTADALFAGLASPGLSSEDRFGGSDAGMLAGM